MGKRLLWMRERLF